MLSDNKIKVIGVDAFSGLVSLIYIYLEQNLLKGLSKAMFRNNLNLSNAEFSRNQITSIEGISLWIVLKQSSSTLSFKFKDGTFSDRPNLYADFSTNNLTSIGIIGPMQINKFIGNQIKSFVISPTAQEIDIDENLLITLNCTNVSEVTSFRVSIEYSSME